MTRVKKFPHGTPAWTDLQSPDTEAAKRFYGSLFGWQYQDVPTAAGQQYSTALLDGAEVAAIAGQTLEAVAAGIRTTWNIYFAVDDVDAALAKVVPAGGRVLSDAAAVDNFGRMALVEDAIGAPIVLLQATERDAVIMADEPGSMIWHELSAGNWEHGVPFYLEVLGGDKHEQEMDGGTYTTLSVAGEQVAGFNAPETVEAPPHWEVYFAVRDADAGAAAARGAGGVVLTEPFDVPGVGRMASLSDPAGAQFWILQPMAATEQE